VVKLALETFSPLFHRYSISIPTGNNRTVKVWAARQRALPTSGGAMLPLCPFFHIV
jgi:hypothetical protein